VREKLNLFVQFPDQGKRAMDAAFDSRLQAAIQTWHVERAATEERILQKLEYERLERTDLLKSMQSDVEKLKGDLQISCEQHASAIQDAKTSVDAVRQQQEVQGAGLSRLVKSMTQISAWATHEMEGDRIPSRSRQPSNSVDPSARDDRSKLHLQLAALNVRIDNLSQSGKQVTTEQMMQVCDEYMSSRAQDIMTEIAEVRKSWIHEVGGLRAHVDAGLKQAQVPADSLLKLRALLDSSRSDMRNMSEEIAHERVERYNAIQELRQLKDSSSTSRQRPSVSASHANDAEERCNRAADAVEANLKQLEELKVELQQMRIEQTASTGTDSLSNSVRPDLEATIRMLKEGVSQVQKELPILAKAVVDTRDEVQRYVAEEQSKRSASESCLEGRICKVEELISVVRSNIGFTKSMSTKEPKQASESIPSCAASTAGSTISGEDNINSSIHSQASTKTNDRAIPCDLKGNLDSLIAAVQMTLRDENCAGQEPRSEARDPQKSPRSIPHASLVQPPISHGPTGLQANAGSIAQDRRLSQPVRGAMSVSSITPMTPVLATRSQYVQGAGSVSVSQGPPRSFSKGTSTLQNANGFTKASVTPQVSARPHRSQSPVHTVGSP